MKRLIVLLLLLIPLNAYGDIKTGVSPLLVTLNGATVSREITFPYPSRDLLIYNEDATGGLWVNLQGNDILPLSNNSGRVFIGADEQLELTNFVTSAITLFIDVTYTGNDSVSPVSVIELY